MDKQEIISLALLFLLGMVVVCHLRRYEIIDTFVSGARLYKTHEGAGCQSDSCKASNDFRHSIGYMSELNIDSCEKKPKVCQLDDEESLTRPKLLSDEEELELLYRYVAERSPAIDMYKWA